MRTVAIMQHYSSPVGHEYAEMQQQFDNRDTARRIILSARSVTPDPWVVRAYRVVGPESTSWLTEAKFTDYMTQLLEIESPHDV